MRILSFMTPWIAAGGLAAGMLPASAQAEFERFDIDPSHFSVGFLVHHLGYADTLGMFLDASGSFEYDAEAQDVRAIEVTLQSESVFTNQDRRDAHLRSGEFLDVENHPVITFAGTSAEATGPDSGIVHGDLTILGQTHPISFEVTLNKADDYPFGAGPPYVIGISARGTVTRSLYGMSYAVDNGWVGDEIDVIIEFEAIRATE